jgi:hypothetical protein
MMNFGKETLATDWSPSLQLFFYLQLLDVLTTLLGFRLGLSEASPFIQFLMHFGVLTGLLGSKVVAVCLAAFCVWRRRFRVITLINYWYAALVIWNLALIATR